MKFRLLIISLLLFVPSSAYAFEELRLEEFQQKVSIINSHAWFKGNFYLGSDEKLHYFTEEWDYQNDPKYKIAREKLDLNIVFPFGKKKLGFSPIKGVKYKILFIIGKHKYYIYE